MHRLTPIHCTHATGTLFAVALLLALGSSACLARTARPDLFVADHARNIEGGRKVLIVLQSDRPADDNPDVARVSETLAPLRTVLASDDFETRMHDRLATVVNAATWMGARDLELTHDYRWARIERALNEANTRQMLVLRTDHSLSPDFMAMRVYVRAILLNRQIPRGKTGHARLQQDYTPYQLDFTARISLPGAEPTKRAENRDLWAANDGSRARQAIALGIEWVSARFAQTLAEDERQSAAWRERGDRIGMLPNGNPGWILERRPDGIICYESRARSLTFEVMLQAAGE